MPFLPEAVTSVLEQSYSDFELLVINDGSTDEGPDYLQSLTDPRLKVISCEHLGIVDALNHGLAVANGRFIARMDADDRCHPQRLERQVAFLNQHPRIGLVGTGARHWFGEEGSAGFGQYIQWNNRLVTPEDLYRSRFVESPLIHPTVMFRKEIAEQHGGYRAGDFPEDYELWLRWLEAGVRMAKLDWVGLDWRERPFRLSRSDQRYAVHAFYRTKAQYLAQWLLKKGHHERGILIWGAGRVSRLRAEELTFRGISIYGYIDIDPHKIGNRIHGRSVMSPKELPPPGTHFLLSYVGNRGARDQIEAFLKAAGYLEECHYLVAA
jgi:glycosyltransferase involved in cell wall biosynthesis